MVHVIMLPVNVNADRMLTVLHATVALTASLISHRAPVVSRAIVTSWVPMGRHAMYVRVSVNVNRASPVSHVIDALRIIMDSMRMDANVCRSFSV